jgi:hypothetical protein
LLHGEAVAIGMCVTAEVSYCLGLCDKNTVGEHYKYIGQAGLPIYVPEGLSLDAIQEKLCYDKHYVKKPAMGLLAEIGHMHCNEDGSYAVEVDNDVIRSALQANFARREKLPKTKDLYTLDTVSPVSSAVNFASMHRSSSNDMYGCDCGDCLRDDIFVV